MKRLSLILILGSLAACGGGSPSNGAGTSTGPIDCSGSAILGTWYINPGPSEILTLNSDCSGYSAKCNQSLTFTPPTGFVGSVTLTLGANDGSPGCSAAGTYVCGINYNATAMALNCGAGVINYVR